MKNKLFNKILCSCFASIVFCSSLTCAAQNSNIKETLVGAESNSFDIIVPFSQKCAIGDKITFDISVSQKSNYELELKYNAIGTQNPIISLKIDGEYPNAYSERIEFSNEWVDSGKKRVDENGNEIAAQQILSENEISGIAMNRTGLFELPYNFNLTQGVHKITIEVFQSEFDLTSVNFKKPEQPQKYVDYISAKSESEKTGDSKIIEAEDAFVKSDKALIPLSDSTSAEISPSSPTVKKLNYIGGSNWSSVGDTISWKFKCDEAGYYSLGFIYKQETIINGISYRHLKIDGKTPFEEARRVKFKYCSSWDYFEYSNDEKPYLFYLDEGEHTLSLAVTAGELSQVYSSLNDIVADLGELYIDITMIVGETVDNNRSYELFNQIPDFNGRLDNNVTNLNGLIDIIEKIQGKNNGSLVSNIISAVEILEQMRDNPYSAHKYKSAYYTAYTNLSATLGTLTNMPLDIDRIFITGASANFDEPKVNFLDKMLFSAKRFFVTFAEDYNSTNIEDEAGVTLWVNWGRDQAQVLSALIREDFTAKTGIDVNVKVTNASIIQGILAGKGPDVMLNMSRAEPINLAMRGALVDLSSFEDYGDTIKYFAQGAEVPYMYKGKTYALPDSQNFYMMFIRTDIFDKFELDVPETWEEFLDVATTLQRNNLQVYLPYTQITASTTVNVGVGGLTLYPTVLMQNGLSLYSEDLSQSTLTEAARLKVFTEWCEWYTKYKIPTVMDFYNRFRIGSVPIGISTYTLITQIKATCPEIEGHWTVTKIPGVKREDGTIDYTSAGSGSGCAITKLSNNPDLAWKFLKWWISADTQVKYSNNLESYIGPLGRVATANVEALDNMGWDAQLLPAIKDQHKHTKEIEEVPGGYYTARGIDQAFWNVVEQNKKPKDMLIEWGEIVNREIKRKRKEYE